MNNEDKMQEQLINALEEMRRQVAELERSEIELKQTIEKLKNQLRFDQMLLDSIPLPVFYKNKDLIYMGCNKAYENFLNIGRDQFIGKTIYDIAPKELADVYLANDLELLQSPGVQIYEARVLDKKSEEHNVVFHKSTYTDADGQIAGLIGAVWDITDRKRAEEALKESENKFRILTEKAVVGVYLIQDGVFKYINPRGADLLGYTADELYMQSPKDVIVPEDWPTVRNNLNKRLSGEIDSINYEIRILKKDKEVVLAEVYGSLIMYNRRPAILGTLNDISERKRAEKEQLHREKLQAVLEMAGAICHEMNQPMQIISGLSEFLSMNISEDDQIKGKIETIRKQIDRMAAITQKLMNIKYFETQDYAGISKIVDIKKSSGDDN